MNNKVGLWYFDQIKRQWVRPEYNLSCEQCLGWGEHAKDQTIWVPCESCLKKGIMPIPFSEL